MQKALILGETIKIWGEKHLSDWEVLTPMTGTINRRASSVKVTWQCEEKSSHWINQTH